MNLKVIYNLSTYHSNLSLRLVLSHGDLSLARGRRRHNPPFHQAGAKRVGSAGTEDVLLRGRIFFPSTVNLADEPQR
ncbi:hypothetical protein PsorP6_012130 [Peronosclerospora sorghi]|uniref:Uncharacterized protein n=1 Tax=Peronosclerospora sorghi TaxID=230839 RepID=A0ACC0WJA4_9STRA|nr:hypothetical protein PsorP6_012130 [Peronosclerospora sorghi]